MNCTLHIAASSILPALWRPHRNWQLLSADVLHKQLGRTTSLLTVVTELASARRHLREPHKSPHSFLKCTSCCFTNISRCYQVLSGAISSTCVHKHLTISRLVFECIHIYMSKRQCLAFKFLLTIDNVELLNNVCWLILSEAELNSRAFKLFLFWKLRVWPSFRQRKQQSVSQESKVEKFTSVLFPKRPQPLKCDSINLHSTFRICLSEQKTAASGFL